MGNWGEQGFSGIIVVVLGENFFIDRDMGSHQLQIHARMDLMTNNYLTTGPRRVNRATHRPRPMHTPVSMGRFSLPLTPALGTKRHYPADSLRACETFLPFRCCRW